jgi:hypothetical protein
MRVLKGVAHTPDYQHVAKFISQKELFWLQKIHLSNNSEKQSMDFAL